MNLKAAAMVVVLTVYGAGSYWGGWRLRALVDDSKEARAEAARNEETLRAVNDARQREQRAVDDAFTNQGRLRDDLRLVLERLRDYRPAAGPVAAGMPTAPADRPDPARADPLTDVLAGALEREHSREADAALAGATAARLAACVRQLQADRLTVNGNP